MQAVVGTVSESWLSFMEKIMECDKPKCAGTNVHGGLKFMIQLCLLSL